MKLTLLLIFSFLSFQYNYAQNRECGFEGILENLSTDSAYQRHVLDYSKKAKLHQGNKSQSIFFIPVVVHVISKNANENISNQQIESQINVLNKDFRKLNADTSLVAPEFNKADVKIEFVLAKRDTNGNSTSGIIRYSTTIDNVGNQSLGNYYKIAKIWNRDDYLNIWVCDIGGNIAGYAYPPGTAAHKDGVVIDYTNFGTIGTVIAPYHLGRTATHEIGHWFNLLHPWGPGASNFNCNQDDGVSDTPLQREAYSGCPASSTSCGSKDMLSNFMGYVNDACMGNFTEGQKDRMRMALVLSRTSLLLSKGALPIGLESYSYLNNASLFPNPSNGSFNLKLPVELNDDDLLINLFDNLGKETPVSIIHQGNQLIINCISCESGLYFLKLNHKNSVKTFKVLIKS